jgi:protein-tyrosine phosphatase
VSAQEGFCDIHTHVLPDVDDGPRTIEESLSIIGEAASVGVNKILCTPHFSAESPSSLPDTISRRFDLLRKSMLEKKDGVEIHLGTELMIHPDLSEVIRSDGRLTVNGSGRYALIETPLSEIPPYTRSVMFDLLVKGTTPIWAHPERCRHVMRDYRVLDPYIQSGVLIQLNAGSLLGLYGWSVRKTAEKLVKNGYVHMCASDTHHMGNMKEWWPLALRKITKIIGATKAVQLCSANPSRVIG